MNTSTKQLRFLPGMFVLSLLFACFCATAQDDVDFVSIFDGKTLKGWRADPESNASAWSVMDGAIQGEGQEDRLAYLIYSGDEELIDFELRFSYRMLTKGNSGVELRSRVDQTGKRPLEGYHADLGHVGIGPQVLGAWDFHFATRKEFPCERGTQLVIDENGGVHYNKIENHVKIEDIKKHDWNSGHIIARGNHFQFFINGKLSSEFTDGIKEGRLESGSIGLQLHDKGMVVEFKDIGLKRLTSTVESSGIFPRGKQRSPLSENRRKIVEVR